MIHFYISDIG